MFIRIWGLKCIERATTFKLERCWGLRYFHSISRPKTCLSDHSTRLRYIRHNFVVKERQPLRDVGACYVRNRRILLLGPGDLQQSTARVSSSRIYHSYQEYNVPLTFLYTLSVLQWFLLKVFKPSRLSYSHPTYFCRTKTRHVTIIPTTMNCGCHPPVHDSDESRKATKRTKMYNLWLHAYYIPFSPFPAVYELFDA